MNKRRPAFNASVYKDLRTRGHSVDCPRLPLWTMRSCVFKSSAYQVSLEWFTANSHNPNHDQPAELRCRGTFAVERSYCYSTETGDDAAY